MNKRGFVALVAGSLVSLTIVMGPASAASATSRVVPTPKYYVSSTAPLGGNDNSCNHAGYSTVQSAVDAAQLFEASNVSDPIIELCGGTFSEQVYVADSLSFVRATGEPKSTIELPASVGSDQTQVSNTACQAGDSGANVTNPQSVIEICQTGSPATVSITDVTIDGNWPSNVCYDSLYGILVGGGATLDLTGSTVENIGGSAVTDGCQGGVAVQVGFSPTNEVGIASLVNDTINTYGKNGITIDGPGSSATISGGSVAGVGLPSATAQNGIQISSGASATISNVHITANECGLGGGVCGSDPWSETQSTGVLLFDAASPTTVKNSTISGNDVGVYNYQDSSPVVTAAISDNSITGGDESVVEDSGSSTVSNNKLQGANIGIWIPQYDGQANSAQISATHDIITGNSVAGVQVESDGNGADNPVLASITHDDLSGNPIGVQNNSSSNVTATNDYWGGAHGPSGTGIGTSPNSAVDPNVTFFPWDRTDAHSGTTATPGTAAVCSASGTSAANAILCLSGPASATYTGPGPVLVLASASVDLTLGTPSTAVNGVSLIFDGGTSTVVDNGSSGLYQEWNGASVTFTNGANMQMAQSGLVTG